MRKALTVERLRRKARRVQLERVVTTVASVPLTAAFALIFLAAAAFGDVPLTRLGCMILAAALLDNLYRQMRSEWGVGPVGDSLILYRAQLARRVDLMRGFLYRNGLAMAAGAIVAAIGWILAEPDRWSEAATACGLGVGLPIAVWTANTRRIARLQKEIQVVDRWTGSANR